MRVVGRRLLFDDIIAEHAATNTDDDDGHPYLCQLLAATRPVRVARAPTAASRTNTDADVGTQPLFG